MSAHRICELCKTSSPMKDMLKLGKQFLCADKIECYKRKLAAELAAESEKLMDEGWYPGW